VGLVIGREGFPKAHEIFAGNLQDRKSVPTMLTLMEQRFGLNKGATIVVDRGMSQPENIQAIRERGYHYVVATPQKERDRLLAEFEDLDGFEPMIRKPSPRNPCQKKTLVRVKLHLRDGELFVLCMSEERVAKDRAIREKQEARFLADAAKLQARIANGRIKREVKIGEAIGRLKERYPRVARYHVLSYDKTTGQLRRDEDEPKKGKAEQLDGSYLLRTDRTELTAPEAWQIYSSLTRAEDAFRTMKSPLAERPIFHQLEHRVETHVFLCVLAYHLLVAIETTLLRREIHSSWATVRDLLAKHEIATIVLPTDGKGVLRIRRASKPEPDHCLLYEALGITPDIMHPIKTWEKAHDSD
jgi:transposase